jgi:sacsin
VTICKWTTTQPSDRLTLCRVLRRSWVSLNNCNHPIGLRDIVPVLETGTATFVSAESEDTARVLEYFELAKCPTTLEVLRDFIIPFWEDKTTANWTTSGKTEITKLVLRHFYNLDEQSQVKIASMAIIPVMRIDGRESGHFARAMELIDPTIKNLQELFFDDEEIRPAEWVLRKYRGILVECCMKTNLDEELVQDRVRLFSKRSEELDETSKRARRLLESGLPWISALDTNQDPAFRELRWLPAYSQGTLTFKNSMECRSLGERLLVGSVLPILDSEVSTAWQTRLGWNDVLPQTTILAQLEYGSKQTDRKIVDAVLTYIENRRLVERLEQDLRKLSCILTTNGKFVAPYKAFYSSCERLSPYLFNVDSRFSTEHESLLAKLGIKLKPDLDDLVMVQENFAADEPLNETDIPIAIEVIKLGSAFPRKNSSVLKILDETGRLRAMEDVTFHDRPLSTITGTFHSTHPDIPTSVIKNLQIEPLSDRIRKGELGIADADDDEFDQQEDVPTRISDTLTYYSVESTFKEFLANADDCKSAKQLNWLLDERQHPRKYLLPKELGEFQGPALVVHNDGGTFIHSP